MIRKEEQVATGTVKWFNDSLFAHHTEIQMSGFKSLKEGQKVEYEPIQGQKGPAASKIRPV